MLPLSPPMILKTPDPSARLILEQWRQTKFYQGSVSAKNIFPGDEFTSPSIPLSENPSIPSEDVAILLIQGHSMLTDL